MRLTDDERALIQSLGLTEDELSSAPELEDDAEGVQLAEDERFARQNGLTAEQYAAWKRAGLSQKV